MKNLLILLSLPLAISACNQNNIFDKQFDVKNQKWSYTDTLNFPFDIKDTSELYNIVLHVKHQTDYPLQNLYLNIYTAFPAGQRIKQLLNIDLADQTGKWNGKVNGKSCDFDIKIQENAFFNIQGKHTITLEQFTRLNPLPAIQTIGLTIEDTKHKKS